MDKILSENLFLLEFLVDEVNLHPDAIPPAITNVCGDTLISIKFLDNDPLEISEADFNPQKCCANMEGNMKNGKSCLFAISPKQINDIMRKFDLEVEVFKKLTNGMLPDRIQIGHAVVPMESLFNEIIYELQNNNDASTASKTLKDKYPIIPTTSTDRCCIGDLGVFIRMSCFGKLIVTQFQMNLQEKSVFFKDKEGKSLYKYRKAPKEDTGLSDGRPDECDLTCPGYDACMGESSSPASNMPWCSPYPSCCSPLCEPPSCYPPPCNRPPCYISPCDPSPCYPPSCNPSPCYPPSCNPSPCYPPSCNPPSCCMSPCVSAPCAPVPCYPSPSRPPDKSCYQEIGAEMNGNALTIRVHKNKGFSVKRIDENGKEVPMITDCSCDQPKPITLPSCSCAGGVPMCIYPDPCTGLIPCMPSPCMEPQTLCMKQADDPANPFTFKVSGCGTTPKHNVTIIPPMSTKQNDGTQIAQPGDANKDVFVLRIGKKNEGIEKKANLELELVTPKGKDKKPIPRKETRDTQYNNADLPEKSSKKKSKSSKGKKKRKKKKSKK